MNARRVSNNFSTWQIADTVLSEALAWLDGGGEIAIFDASNASVARRARQSAKVSAHAAATGVPIATVFLETIIESPALLLENMRAKVRASPDYYGRDEVAAMDDLRRRCTLYERCADRGMTTGSSRDYRGITT